MTPGPSSRPGDVLGLDGSESGISYQLYLDGSPVDDPEIGDGSSISFGSQTAPGIYTVIATDPNDGSTEDMTGSVDLNSNPTVYNVSSAGSACSGGVVISLNASQTGVEYQLVRGTTNVGTPVTGNGTPISFPAQSTAGTYTVVATNTAGCSADMNGDAVVAAGTAPTSFDVTGGGSVCPGDAGIVIGVDDSQTGVEYQLVRGTTNVGAPVIGDGTAITFPAQ